MKSNRIYWIWNYLDVMMIRAKNYFNDHLAKHMPKIPRKRPKAPFCPVCFARYEKQIPMKLKAYSDADGWSLFWECDREDCNEIMDIDYRWFPFVFNWATDKDMERIGIEVV